MLCTCVRGLMFVPGNVLPYLQQNCRHVKFVPEVPWKRRLDFFHPSPVQLCLFLSSLAGSHEHDLLTGEGGDMFTHGAHGSVKNHVRSRAAVEQFGFFFGGVTREELRLRGIAFQLALPTCEILLNADMPSKAGSIVDGEQDVEYTEHLHARVWTLLDEDPAQTR